MFEKLSPPVSISSNDAGLVCNCTYLPSYLSSVLPLYLLTNFKQQISFHIENIYLGAYTVCFRFETYFPKALLTFPSSFCFTTQHDWLGISAYSLPIFAEWWPYFPSADAWCDCHSEWGLNSDFLNLFFVWHICQHIQQVNTHIWHCYEPTLSRHLPTNINAKCCDRFRERFKNPSPWKCPWWGKGGGVPP